MTDLRSAIKSVPLLGPACVNVNRFLWARKLKALFDYGDYRRNFTKIYETNFWGSSESVSGVGSNLHYTSAIRQRLPDLWNELGVRSMLDAPCGDFYWMKELDLRRMHYIGADIVEALIAANNQTYGRERIEFHWLDIINDDLPRVDLVLCRDCLVHLHVRDIIKAVANVKRSGARFLLTTNFHDLAENRELPLDHWREINLQAAPFHFPPPIEQIVETDSGDQPQFTKTLALWKVADLPGGGS